MRIAYFSGTLRLGQDGVTRVVYKMIEGALAKGHEAIGFGALVPESDQCIVPVYRVPSITLPFQKAYRLALPGYKTFAKELQKFGADILHVNSPCTLGWSAVQYARRFNIPIVATYHTHFPTYPRYYHLKGLEEFSWVLLRRFYSRVGRTFVPTQPILQELQDHGIRNLQLLSNGVDVKLFNPEYRSEAWREQISTGGKPIVLFVSRLVWEKDIRILAEMYRILRERRDDFEMVLVGDGHVRSELGKMMLGAHFLGYQSGRQLAESYASSDIFVFPSTTETFGLVTLEAMASGVVPVAAKVGGAAEIIEEGKSGMFAAPFDPQDLADKVEWLLDHPHERKEMAQKAIGRAQHFGWERILDQLFAQYEDVCTGYISISAEQMGESS